MHDNAVNSAAAALASKGAKLHTHEIHLRRGHKGGYIAKHDMRDENGNMPEDGQKPAPEYPIANHAAMLAHVSDHMGPPEPDAQAEMNQLAGQPGQ